MRTGKGQVVELRMEVSELQARIACPSGLIPSPGQYLLAGDGSLAALPVPLFHTDSVSEGFIAAPVPGMWRPGMDLYLRGPLGQGFNLATAAQKIGLIAYEVPPTRLRGLIAPILRQGSSVVLVCDSNVDHWPDAVEVQPMSALEDIIQWADFLALDVDREKLNSLRARLKPLRSTLLGLDAQVLVRTPVPCGGVAECGVCAVTVASSWRLGCKEGPVFRWQELE